VDLVYKPDEIHGHIVQGLDFRIDGIIAKINKRAKAPVMIIIEKFQLVSCFAPDYV